MSQSPGSTDGRPPFSDAAAALAGFDQNPALVVVARGPQHQIVATNQTVRAWLPGRPMLGLPVLDAFAQVADQQLVDLCDDCYRTGARQDGHEWAITVDDGAGSVMEVVCDITIVPWRDAEGHTVGVVGTATDITTLVTGRLAAELGDDGGGQDLPDERETLSIVQDALLPYALPILPGLDLAGTYLPPAHASAGGGDWFDAVVRPGGRVALVVGDVVGHGVTASAVMGQLRAVLSHELSQDRPLCEALSAVDRFARLVPEAHAATIAVAELAPSRRQVEYCTAGHPPPLLVSSVADRSGYLTPTGSPPLATTATSFPTRTATIGAGDLLVLYTNGLVQRPGRTPSQNTLDLARTVEAVFTDLAPPGPEPHRFPERVCDRAVELLTRAAAATDDVALVAARPVAEPPRVERTYAAEAGSVAAARRDVSAWLAELGARHLDVMAVQTAVGELVTNAVEHAYPTPGPGQEVRVSARLLETGVAEVRVEDHGHWRPARDEPHRGRGLALSRGLVDELDLSPGTGRGTTATLRQRMCQPARLLDHLAGAGGWGPAPAVEEFNAVSGPGTLRVTGPVGEVDADRLRAGCLRATQGGTADAVIHLGEVTVLSSSGVQVLYEFAGDGVQLRARAGSPAQHVLQLVGLPYATSET